ncbi:bifunctional cobalt-precorrin-7 (C(5))-methyltransferase/cobalt-precorrin-6B (C(15))-methyltransferase [Ahrensia sp. R2A130]|uniref:bifunctional cobalt-precorrin-7 (C(5))-methyltransferase/cobalt-precorrin-6B (C(15))-methyltransferase n=1 Tax=Ahrensia sp. R2A130 TaxID=744979 RepID=UPI0001E0AC66|nr:bifunctional cobalt-precorrin-7 (C(5))-methyltransferase/cobalt-precorrin-6B (C(15))-methyltransferase [Ahrensia sp. R2A130]EFL90683.1 precorrin-6Y C(5,15)-methyltransferase (decarboxylating) [Ahrensia sp. R2A130]
MVAPWLHIIGIGEDGIAGLAESARRALEEAEVIIGGDRHHELAANVTAERMRWPSPFNAMIDTIRAQSDRKPVILVTGDPLWYSVGARITKAIPADEIRFHPQLSAFQWAAARMGWSIADCETATVHGRAASQLLPHLAPNIRILLLTKDRTTPATVAALLNEWGFGESRMTALAALGGEAEQRFDGLAVDWAHDVPDFHTLAIECVAGPDARWYPRGGGLPDDAFEHDGQMTKQDVRAVTLAKLAPYPDAMLWDIGAGCGSVSVEWMRAARGAVAYAVEPKAERRAMIVTNSVALGTEKIIVVEGKAPAVCAELPPPDAVFIGGGATTPGVFEAAWSALRPGGRLVANGVTLETESRLADLHREHGGEMARIAVQKAEAVGPYRGWRASMPVTQWCVVKPMGEDE